MPIPAKVKKLQRRRPVKKKATRPRQEIFFVKVPNNSKQPVKKKKKKEMRRETIGKKSDHLYVHEGMDKEKQRKNIKIMKHAFLGRTCAVCGEEWIKLYKCAACYRKYKRQPKENRHGFPFYYCSKKCQRWDWARGGHRDFCPKRRACVFNYPHD
jgi:hypothetical protein